MKHWEFLLQKEGDRSWLPLDSPDVEILEGRYRIVARSATVNAAIDVRISHLATEEDPPKRRLQKRSCRTNQDGLMVVIPFTRLAPGLWDLHCSPADLMSDLMAGAQPYTVKLQVLAREAEQDDWEPDWSESTADASPSAPQATPAAAKPSQPTQRDAEADVDSLQASASQPSIAANDRSATMPPEVAEILTASMDRLFQIAEQMSEQLVDEVLQDFDLTAIADAPTNPESTVPLDEPRSFATAATVTPVSDAVVPDETSQLSTPTGYTLAADETFVLTLDRSTLVTNRRDVLTLTGQVAIATQTALRPDAHTAVAHAPVLDLADPWDIDADAINLTGATALEVQLCLRDPQSLQVLLSDRQPLPHGSPPFAFTFTFSLPAAFATHLVLGEVLLCGALPDKTDSSIALITQAFSVTVDPNELVDELSKLNEALTTEVEEKEEEDRIDLPLELVSRVQKQDALPFNLSFLNLVATEPSAESPTGRSTRFPSLAGQPLPPQIYRPDPELARHKTLDLPAFKLAQPLNGEAIESRVEEPDPEITVADTPADASIAASTELAIEPNPPASPPIAVSPEQESVETSDEDAADEDAADPIRSTALDTLIPTDQTAVTHAENPPLDSPSPSQRSFQSLNLQERFLTRLASLATESARQKAENNAVERAAESTMPPNPIADQAAADARSTAEEVVVDDEPLPRRDSHRATPKPSLGHEAPADNPPNPLVLPADLPVPTPTMTVTSGELVAGKSINIRVNLPNLLPRIYVKLWVIDRQTRSLLDGPRWLVDFLPNGLGDLEAMTPRTVPFGSVELRFEAIAVEMHTQRESHKVTVDRTVVPPDLPTVSLDDFNGSL